MTTIERVQQYQNQINDLNARIDVMNASRAGIRIESRVRNGSVMYDWTYCKEPTWDWANFGYRIAPEPKIIPWTRDDVPFNAMYRERVVENSPWRTPLSKAFNGLRFYDCFMHYELLADNWEHTTDGKTWKPCHKYEN